jgi:hypothetical protein
MRANCAAVSGSSRSMSEKAHQPAVAVLQFPLWEGLSDLADVVDE